MLFDKHGSLITAAWLKEKIELNDSSLLSLSTPLDEMLAAATEIESLHLEQSFNEITLGLCDESSAVDFKSVLDERDIPSRLSI